MCFSLTAFRIFIASPGDANDERHTIQRAIYEWTAHNSHDTGIALIPLLWEEQATPESGESPQSIINRQLLDQSDAVIVILKTRLGAGTLEEIERSIEAKKTVQFYLYNGPLPNNVASSELDELRAYRKKLQDRCLFAEFGDLHQLTLRISRNLTSLQRTLATTVTFVPSPGPSKGEWVTIARELYRRGSRGARQLPGLLSPLQMSSGDSKIDAQRFGERAAEVSAVLN